MKARRIIAFGVVLLGFSLGLGNVLGRKGRPGGPKGTAPVQSDQNARPKLDFHRLPLGFEEMTGLPGGPEKFLARGAGYALYLEPTGAVMELSRTEGSVSAALRIRLEGAQPSPRLVAEDRLPGVSHYFIGSDPAAWRTGIPHYARVRAIDVYPGIDLVYYGNHQELEFDLVIEAGGDPSGIVLALDGARKIEIDGSGDLLADLGTGEVRMRRPNIYQGSRDEKEPIDGRFIMRGQNRVGFDVAPYDPDRPLVIDPSVVYSTYFGGNNWDVGGTITVDSAGYVYFFGSTHSANVPMVNALYPTYRGGDYDVVVAKLNPAGNTLLFSTYFGGNAWDTGATIAVDSDGDIYITGVTDSMNFPLVSPLQSRFGGAGTDGFGDAFVTKMKGDGSALLYSTYLGGARADHSRSIAVDAGKNTYVLGVTESANFPTVNPYQSTLRGPWDAFLSKINADGSAFVYSTFFGGSGSDFGGDLAVTGAGVASIVGNTNSASDFPLANAYQTSFGGGGDAFVTKFDASGQSLIFSTYLGGSYEDVVMSVGMDASQAVYVAGRTQSTNFPTANPYQGSYGGGDWDGFVSAFAPDGSSLHFSTYLGGSGYEEIREIVIGSAGNAHVAGQTDSPNFPLVNPVQASPGGGSEAFASVFSTDGSGLVFSTCIGGSNGDCANSVRLDGDGNIYLAGGTESTNFPTLNALVPIAPGGGDYWIAKIEAVVIVPGPVLTSLLPSSASAGDPGFLLSVVGADFVDGAVVRWDGNNRSTIFVSSSEVDATINASDLAAGKTAMITVRNPDTGVSNAQAFTINNPVPSLASVSPTSMTGGGSAFTLTVQGSNFVPNSVVRWNGNSRTTTYVSGTELQAAIGSGDLLTPGEVQVTVVNPAPAGGASMATAFSIAGYTATSTPASVTVMAGQSATYTVSLTPQYGSFDSAVTFSCVGLPNKCAATFAPTSVTPGAGNVTTTLTLATQASSGSGSVLWLGVSDFSLPALGLFVVALSLILGVIVRNRIPWKLTRRWLAASALVCLIILIGNCSSGGGDDNPPPYSGTPKGTHQILVQAVSGTLRITTTVTLVVN